MSQARKNKLTEETTLQVEEDNDVSSHHHSKCESTHEKSIHKEGKGAGSDGRLDTNKVIGKDGTENKQNNNEWEHPAVNVSPHTDTKTKGDKNAQRAKETISPETISYTG